MKRSLQGESQARDWWRTRVKATPTPFFAKADTRLSPVNVSKDMIGVRLFSVVFERGTRFYCFDSQANRDRFLTRYRKVFGAQAVGKDPCP